MLIGLSAGQGQGKTTVLNSLEKRGYKVVPQKTSRSILTEWGFTLNQVNSVKFLTEKFQKEIIKKHTESVKDTVVSSDIVFQERTMADIFTYCLNILGPFNEYNSFVNEYYNQCKQLQQNYDCVIYLTGRHGLQPENDGVRSINPQFMKFIDMGIRHYVNDFDNGNVLRVDTPDHDTRIQMIVDHIETLKQG